jgi:hypothetical protein
MNTVAPNLATLSKFLLQCSDYMKFDYQLQLLTCNFISWRRRCCPLDPEGRFSNESFEISCFNTPDSWGRKSPFQGVEDEDVSVLSPPPFM